MTTQVSDKAKKIKASLGFAKLSDTALLQRLDAILVSMTNNPAFPSPAVDGAMSLDRRLPQLRFHRLQNEF